MTRAVADPGRLRVLRALTEREGPYDPERLASELGLSPRVAARHVGALHALGILEAYDAGDEAGTQRS